MNAWMALAERCIGSVWRVQTMIQLSFLITFQEILRNMELRLIY